MAQTWLRIRRSFVCDVVRASVLVGVLAACSGDSEPRDRGMPGSGEDDAGGDDTDGSEGPGDDAGDTENTLDAAALADGGAIDTLTLDPPSATLRVSSSAPQTMQFRAYGALAGSAPELVPASYQLDRDDLGTLDAATGMFTSNGRAGGVLTVSASYQGMQSSAQLTVILALEEALGAGLPANPGSLFDPTKNQVVTSDAAHTPKLIYPVPETMFPQNLAHVLFQWRANGAKLFQLAFHSDVLDYKIYTNGVQDTCAKAGTQGACWQSDEAAWEKLARSNAGQNVTLTLRGVDPEKPGTVYEAAPVTLSFSKQPVPGAIYYWSTTVKGVRRGRMEELSPTNFLTPSETDGKCVACHTLSRNGKAMAADVGGENLWVVDVTKAVPPPRRFTNYQNKNIANAWATFNPDTTRVVNAQNGILTLRNAQTGAPIGPNAGAITLNKNLATMPDWAPNGSRLVFAMGPNAKGRKATAASLAQVSVNGDVFGLPEVIVASSGGDDNSWPMFDPSSQWIAFVKSTASSEKDPTAQVNVVRAQAGATPQPLVRANTLVNDTTLASGLYNNMPTWAPTQEGDMAWVAFTSTRDYGVVLSQGSSFGRELRQLWIAAIDLKKLGAGDPSFPAFHAPFQELSENSHRPFWAEDALVGEDGGVPLDAGVPSDAGVDAGSDAGSVPDGGAPACLSNGADCTSGTCCVGTVCSPDGDNYTCQPILL
jgi:hypothetical protein